MPLIVISMGSGPGCDVQYLFASEILGETAGRIPRHARSYRDFRAEYDHLHGKRIAVFTEFRRDVASGAFPGEGGTVAMAPGQWDRFAEALAERTNCSTDRPFRRHRSSRGAASRPWRSANAKVASDPARQNLAFRLPDA